MKIELSFERRAELVRDLQVRFRTEIDEELSEFRAGEMLDIMLKTLGPAVYNQAVQDVRLHLQMKLDDLDGEVYVDPDV